MIGYFQIVRLKENLMPKNNPPDKSKDSNRVYKPGNNKSHDLFLGALHAGKVTEIGSKGKYKVEKGK